MGVLGPRTHKCENRRQTSLSIRTRLNVLDIGTDAQMFLSVMRRLSLD